MDYGDFKRKSMLDNPYEQTEAGPGYASIGEGAGDATAQAAPTAATAVSGASPGIAAATIGGSFLSNYLAARAAEERQKKELAMRTQENYQQNQTGALSNLMAAYKAALL